MMRRHWHPHIELGWSQFVVLVWVLAVLLLLAAVLVQPLGMIVRA